MIFSFIGLLYSVIFFYLRGIFFEVIFKLEVVQNLEIFGRKSDIHVPGIKTDAACVKELNI